MFQPSLACFQRGLWSDRHGVTKRDPALAFSRASIDPGDLPQNRLVPEYHPQIPAPERRGTEVQGSGEAEQTRSVCGSLTRIVSWSPRKARSFASIAVLSIALMTGRDKPSTTGGIIWRSCNASPVLFAMVLHSSSYPT